MKYLKIGLTIIITSLALNLAPVNAAGSVSVSASANYVEEGNRVTFYINLKIFYNFFFFFLNNFWVLFS